ncbi:MAG: imidazole glycerol phosphate synthase subunit HisH [Opitutales bacterium]|nr:imidazole glycerol phosphate synthase subunit HisH [Opitutales bacterium]MCH8540825.1 imidazole glycerol phosphate synthase subunit HisH [Opitutales bacterium]
MEIPPLSRKPLVAVVDYGMGNLRSVVKALEVCGASVKLIETPQEVGDSEALVFPGQGAIGGCMQQLRRNGFADLLSGWIREDRPYFGICLGMQALFSRSEESSESGLAVFPGEVRRFPSAGGLKIPHMGWNEARWQDPEDPLLEGIAKPAAHFYFVHSYRVESTERDLIWSTTDYGGAFVSGVRRGNCLATQFHPEKSQFYGLRLYRNFLELVCSSTL